MHQNSERIFREFGLPHFRSGSRVLELGPDSEHTLRRLVTQAHPDIAWETADLAHYSISDELDHRMPDEYTFPVGDAEFDIVATANVLEHVRRPWVWVQEAARVLKPGGLLVSVVPANWPYHEAPVDCWRYFPEAFRSLHDHAGLETVDARFESLMNAADRKDSWLNRRNRDARVFVKRALGRPAWPHGGMESEWAVDTIAVGRKPATIGSQAPTS
ncbi:class I SAM-dependent methyltransferase [Dermacoccaceae bacterium W4C1]